MTNVTVQEALKAALAAIDLYDYTMTVEESEKFAKAERLCKAALVEIDKCKPVAYDKNKIRSEVMSKSPIPFGVCDAIDLTMQSMEHLITSPQSRDWVNLTDMQITNIGMQHQSLHQVAYAISDALKHLNTKG